ncbi:hypothetical protein BDY19DRAFT_1049190 [Irpex rosettiformis]|uniref:Uncharacterized protein n=1 Tax=Irpex rosettiformis TaxID=378272 RepID=A0ACB8U0R0_9APHY|nr:hypothetical protein BDY19DRAFT_1049190 [Irpex rosettiformis]
MFSFKSIAVFATLAFGAVSSLAAPTIDTNAVVARCDACDASKGIAGIFADVKVAVTPYVNELHYIKKDNCTVDAIEPLIIGIKVAVNDGLIKVNALAGASVDVILAGAVDATVKVDVNVLAGIVADLVVFIFAGLKVILDLNVTACLSVVIPLFCGLGEVIGALICAVLSICGHLLVGLDVAILALIQVVVSVIVRLNVSVLISVLAIVV